jgi:hypothetical protein
VPLLVYTLLRLAIMVVAFLAIWRMGAEPSLAGVIAIVVAALVSYLALRKQRDASAAWIAARVESRRRAPKTRTAFARGVADDEAAEDAATEDDA